MQKYNFLRLAHTTTAAIRGARATISPYDGWGY